MRNIKCLKKALRGNNRGGIEGLPLQLMIVLIVATMGTAIIVGWMGSIETPQSIGDVSIDSGDIILDKVSGSLHYTESTKVVVFVSDQDGNPLAGATVILTGLGIQTAYDKTPHAITDANGIATFEDLNVKLRGTNIGFVTANVSMPGYGEDSSTRVAVIA